MWPGRTMRYLPNRKTCAKSYTGGPAAQLQIGEEAQQGDVLVFARRRDARRGVRRRDQIRFLVRAARGSLWTGAMRDVLSSKRADANLYAPRPRVVVSR